MSGAAGLPAAVKAADGGASVLVVETNYDIGGHAIISGGNVPLGGGTSAQKNSGIVDTPDLVFKDLTDWSVVEANGHPTYRYNDREIMRAFADESANTYEWLVDRGVVFIDQPVDNRGAGGTGNSAMRENHTAAMGWARIAFTSPPITAGARSDRSYSGTFAASLPYTRLIGPAGLKNRSRQDGSSRRADVSASG